MLKQISIIVNRDGSKYLFPFSVAFPVHCPRSRSRVPPVLNEENITVTSQLQFRLPKSLRAGIINTTHRSRSNLVPEHFLRVAKGNRYASVKWRSINHKKSLTEAFHPVLDTLAFLTAMALIDPGKELANPQYFTGVNGDIRSLA